MTDALRQLMARPNPAPPVPPLLDRLTHGLRCNDRLRITPRLRACSVCGDQRRTR